MSTFTFLRFSVIGLNLELTSLPGNVAKYCMSPSASYEEVLAKASLYQQTFFSNHTISKPLGTNCNWFLSGVCALGIDIFWRFGSERARYLSRRMGKPKICIGENKGADQLRSNCEADQRLCFRYTDSTIPLLSKPKFPASSHLL